MSGLDQASQVERVHPGQMAARWDPQAMADLVARDGELRAEADEVACRIRDLTDTDKTPDGADDRNFVELSAKHTMALRELEANRAAIDRLEARRPRAQGRGVEISARDRWMRGGSNELSAEERQASVIPAGTRSIPTGFDGSLSTADLEEISRIKVPGAAAAELFIEPIVPGVDPQAILTSQSGDPGTDWSPETVDRRIWDTLAYAGGMLGASSEMVTTDGNVVKFPILDEAEEEGELIEQTATVADRDLQNLGEKDMSASIISSKRVIMSLALQQDTAFDMDSVIRRRLNRRIDRTCNTQMTTGDGSGRQFRGATVDAMQAHETADAAALTSDELVETVEKINVAYFEGEGSPAGLDPMGGMAHRGWMLHQNVLGDIRRMKGTDGHFLWRPGLAGLQYADPPSIAGYPYRLNNKMGDLGTAGAVILLFGNFGYYMRRRVNFMLTARYTDSGTIINFASHFIAFRREWGRFVGGFPDIATDACEAVKKVVAKT